MQCESCDIDIDIRFKIAIKNNKCPACDMQIMHSEKLASFISLQGLLQNNFKDLDTEKVASLIIANFNLKQIFKEELPKSKNEGIIKIETIEQNESQEDTTDEVSEDEVSDAEYKKQQIAESKIILRNMRDEILDEAIADQWGLGKANGLIDGSEIREMAEQEKRRMSQENITSGTRGSFRRT